MGTPNPKKIRRENTQESQRTNGKKKKPGNEI
jgi:hypothetical protein